MALRQIILLVGRDFPVGASQKQRELYYQEAVKPLIQLLYARQEWAFCLYLCGDAAAWLNAAHSEAVSALVEMAARKQLEFLGGSYSGALLPMIPAPDRIGQMEAMALAVREHFNCKVRGAFLPYGVWEPSLPHILRSSDLFYTFAPAELFCRSGGAQSAGPYLVEEMGKSVHVFPYCRLAGDGDAGQEAERIMQFAGDEEGVLALAFDHNNTLFLEKTLNALQSKGAGFCLPGAYLKKNANKLCKKIYLGASDAQAFGSSQPFYRNFLLQNKDVQLLYAKALHSSVVARQIKKDKSRKSVACSAIWRAQNHQFYWRSAFGGVANPAARAEAYRNLLQADAIAREAGAVSYGLVRTDFDLDGAQEALYQGAVYNAFTQSAGGALFELDYLPAEKACLNVFGEYELKRAFHDLFLPPETDYRQWALNLCDCGVFKTAFYDLAEVKNDVLSALYKAERPFCDTLLAIEKRYSYKQREIHVHYTLNNNALGLIDKLFAIEFYLSLPADCEFEINGENWHGIESEFVETFSIIDKEAGLRMSYCFSEAAFLWRQELAGAPAETGLGEPAHQGERFLVGWPLLLEAGCADSRFVRFIMSAL